MASGWLQFKRKSYGGIAFLENSSYSCLSFRRKFQNLNFSSCLCHHLHSVIIYIWKKNEASYPTSGKLEIGEAASFCCSQCCSRRHEGLT